MSRDRITRPDSHDTPGLTGSQGRRRFLKTSGKLALTVPAVTLLIAASSVPRKAEAMYTYDPGGWIP